METKQELKEIINELKDRLKKAQDKLENLDKNQRWKPNNDDRYYYVDTENCVLNTFFDDCICSDENRYNVYNCFKTEEEAEKEADKILIRRKLEDLAERLNGDEKIDWDNSYQLKYHILYNTEGKCLTYKITSRLKNEGSVYCLDKNFIDEAIKEIGEKELVSYITND